MFAHVLNVGQRGRSWSGSAMVSGGLRRMVPVALSDVIAVGEVPTAEEIDILARAGFRSILLTQPENEVARLLTKDEVAARSAAAGLAFAYVPVETRRPPEPALTAFADALSSLPRPIYACCYSGARTAAAWALAASRTLPLETVMESCAAAGYDMSYLRSEIAARQDAAARPAVEDVPAPVRAVGVTAVEPPPASNTHAPAPAVVLRQLHPLRSPLCRNCSAAFFRALRWQAVRLSRADHRPSYSTSI